jgi:hypothetical protein
LKIYGIALGLRSLFGGVGSLFPFNKMNESAYQKTAGSFMADDMLRLLG